MAINAMRTLPGHSSAGRLEQLLRRREFAVTAELSVPDSADPDDVHIRARVFDGYVDAINIPDGPAANCHMSSISVSALLTRLGYDTVMQISCRDRNRIAIQGDVLGAAAIGVTAVLCTTGDGVQVGDHPEATPVFDLDGTSLLDTVRVMRDESRFLSGRKLIMPPPLFIGATENPFVPPFDFPPLRLAKKVAAGAQFIQTQCCFDISRLQQFMSRVRDMGLDEKCFILVGVGPLLSANTARWIRSHVRGIDVPDAIVHRLSHAKRQKLEGKKVCLELIQQVREIQGVSGIHVMAYRQEETIAEIIDASGVLDGRVPWYPGRSEGNDRTQAS